MSVFVGLDCGGSSSRALAINADGEIVFQGNSGAANIVSTPEGRLRRNLSHAVEGCPNADYVAGCFAGLINEDLRTRAETYLSQLFPNAQVRAEPDYTAALFAAPAGTDVCVIAGTGSLVCSKSGESVVKSGGRGYLLGDYGSGYQYGRDALIHFLDNPASAPEALRRAIFELFETTQEGVIVASVYKSPTPATLVGKLSKALAADAKAEEPYALQSVEKNGGMLADVVVAHVRKHLAHKKELNVSLAGGVWKAAAIFRDLFEEQLRGRLPSCELRVTRVTRPPLYGAVELAKEMSNFGN